MKNKFATMVDDVKNDGHSGRTFEELCALKLFNLVNPSNEKASNDLSLTYTDSTLPSVASTAGNTSNSSSSRSTLSTASLLSSSESLQEYIDCLFRMADERFHLKKFQEALCCYEEVWRIQLTLLHEKSNVKDDNGLYSEQYMIMNVAYTLSVIADVHIKLQDLATAESQLNTALRIYRKYHRQYLKENPNKMEGMHYFGYLSGLAYTFSLFGQVFIQRGNPEKAMAAFIEALRLNHIEHDITVEGSEQRDRVGEDISILNSSMKMFDYLEPLTSMFERYL